MKIKIDAFKSAYDGSAIILKTLLSPLQGILINKTHITWVVSGPNFGPVIFGHENSFG